MGKCNCRYRGDVIVAGHAFCRQCFLERHGEFQESHGEEAESLLDGEDGETITVTASPFTEWTCQAGHRARHWAGAPFFELLFAHGVHAIAECDYRAAVLNFYSCWDNFVSYVIRILVDDIGNSQVSVPKDYALAERRTGLFAGLCFARTGQWPPLPGSDAAAVRNKVIHDDKIPSETESLKVATAVQEAVTGCKAALTDDLFVSHSSGERAHARFERDLLAAGFRDAIAANAVPVFESGSLVHVDVADSVRRMRLGLPLEDPTEQ